MTQLDEMARLIGNLDTEKTRMLQSRIRTVLAKAQNPPPEGMGDGSFSPLAFDACRKVEQQLGQLARAIDAAHLSIGRLKAGLE